MALANFMLVFGALLVSIYSASCAPSETEKDAYRRKIADEMLSHMDQTADPCNDIYQYACGNFENVHPLADDKSDYILFHEIEGGVKDAVKEGLAEVEDTGGDGISVSPQVKAKRFYESCLDRDTIEARGNEPILNLVKKLGGWPMFDPNWSAGQTSLTEFLAAAFPYYTGRLIGVDIAADLEFPTTNVVTIQCEPQISMSKADIQDAANSNTVKAYRYKIIQILKLLGLSEAVASDYASQFIEFEKQLIQLQPELQRGDVKSIINRMTYGDLLKEFPQIDWDHLLRNTVGVVPEKDYVLLVMTIDYLRNIIPLLESTDPKLIRNWVMMKVVITSTPFLHQGFLDIENEATKISSGATKTEPIEETCLNNVKLYFRNAVSNMYIQRQFSAESRESLRQIAEEIRDQVAELIKEKEWLKDETKNYALEKLNAIEFLVGYRDKDISEEALQKEYKDFVVEPGKYFENIWSINVLDLKGRSKLFGKPVDQQPAQPPTEVNASYDNRVNKVNLPAAFLQPPTYHKFYPRALIYGSVGVFIGHELGHAFDQIGRQFGKDGSLINWWDDASLATFNEKTKCFADHYDQYDLHGIPLNGTNSVGETAADNNGLRAAYFAYKKWWEKNKDTDLANEESLPGLNFTNFDLFFMKHAQGWCQIIRQEAAQKHVQDEHPPSAARLRGEFAINSFFASHYGCPVKADCLVW